MSRITTLVVALFAVVAVIPTSPATASGEQVVIDFEGLAVGTIVSEVGIGSGMSGAPVAGSVGVRGWRDGARGTQRAMVFDGTCAPWFNRFGCSGQDSDLFFPDRGNVLIVSEDLDSTDPDDDTNGGFTFDFRELGPVTVQSLGLLDTNSQTTTFTFVLADGSVVTRTEAGTGDGRSRDVSLSIGDVVEMEVDLNGAGALDQVVVTLGVAVPPTTTTVPAMTTTTTTVPAPTTTTTTVPAMATTTTTVPVGSDLVVRAFVDGVEVSGAPGPSVPAGGSGSVRYEVTNTTSETAWALYIWQEGFGGATCPDRTLTAGETVTCSLEVSFGDVAFAEVADATAWPRSGTVSGVTTVAFTPTSGSTTTTVPAPTTTTTTVPAPTTTTTTVPVGSDLVVRAFVDGVEVSGAPGPSVPAGGSGSVRYEVTNTTSETAWALYIWQEGFGGATCPDRTLTAGETVTCSLEVSFGDVAFAEVADATAWPRSGTVSGVTTVAFTPTSGSTTTTVPATTTTTTTVPATTTTTTVPATTTTTTTVPATTTTVPAPPTGGVLVNVARGKPTVQARSNNWILATPSSRAVDGNRDGDHEAGSVAMTYRVSDAWWEVDLGAAYEIDHVTLWNRTDCCADRLRDFYVFVSEEPFEVQDLEGTMSQPGVTTIHTPGTVGRRIDIALGGAAGRHVRVQLGYVDAVLQLAEVEVMVESSQMSMEAFVDGVAAGSPPGPMILRGDPVPMSFEVTNTGLTRLTGLSIGVDGFGTATCPQRWLPVGTSITCTLETTASPGAFSSTAVATASDPSGREVSASDPLHVFVPAATDARVRLDVLVDGLNGDQSAGPRIAEGELMTFSYLVLNDGAVPLTGVTVTDTRHGRIDCPSSTVQPGETMVCIEREVARLTVTYFDTTVRATAEGRTISDSERLYFHVRPHGREDGLELDVTIDGRSADSAPGPVFEAGRTVRFRYVLTNTGERTNLFSAEIIDPRVPANRMSCSGGPTLGANRSMICTATVVVEAGQWSNVVVGYAWSSNGPRIDASERLYYTGLL